MNEPIRIECVQGGPPPCDLKPGDLVSLRIWDRYERPVNRLGDSHVESIRRAVCETGWLVRVRSNSGRTVELDRNWLEKIT